MSAFEVILTAIVLVAVALFILLYERKRATRIQRDLKRDSEERRR